MLPHASEVVAYAMPFGYSSHAMVTSGSYVISGAVVSSIVNVALVEVALPQSSVAVNVTVTAPVAPQAALMPL